MKIKIALAALGLVSIFWHQGDWATLGIWFAMFVMAWPLNSCQPKGEMNGH